MFGDFRFTPSESLLLKGGEAVPLSPKALNVLEKLVESSGTLVTKDELIREVWEDLAVEESAVPRTVFLVRTALGDDPKNHSFIQTVPKRGYRFVAEVSTVYASNGNTPHAEPVAEVNPAPVPRRFSVAHLAMLLLLLTAATIAAYFGLLRNTHSAGASSLLVMPVSSATTQDGDELLENGIADVLIHHLASSEKITVKPLSVTQSYRGKPIDPRQAGQEQRVSRVLAATYQRADGKLRMIARLINVYTGETDLTHKFETNETGVFAIQDAVVSDLGNKIASRLGVYAVPVRDLGTTNEEAYRHYFQGMALYELRNGVKAVESFDRATQLDPNFARAWVGKAVALSAIPSLGNSTSPELYEKTLEAARRALALDPRSADAYSALCGAKLAFAHDFAGAGHNCDKAMELDPNSAVVLQSYSFLLIAQGRLDEAVQTVKKALDLEPSSLHSQRLYANSMYLSRRYDAAFAQYVKLNELQPDRLPHYEWIIRTLEASGRENEALEWLLRSLKVRNVDEEVGKRIQQAYRESGWAGALSVRLEKDRDSMNYFRQAGVNARLGNKDAAFELLEKAYEQRVPIFLTFRVEPQFDPLRNDPRFEDLIRRVEGRR